MPEPTQDFNQIYNDRFRIGTPVGDSLMGTPEEYIDKRRQIVEGTGLPFDGQFDVGDYVNRYDSFLKHNNVSPTERANKKSELQGFLNRSVEAGRFDSPLSEVDEEGFTEDRFNQVLDERYRIGSPVGDSIMGTFSEYVDKQRELIAQEGGEFDESLIDTKDYVRRYRSFLEHNNVSDREIGIKSRELQFLLDTRMQEVGLVADEVGNIDPNPSAPVDKLLSFLKNPAETITGIDGDGALLQSIDAAQELAGNGIKTVGDFFYGDGEGFGSSTGAALKRYGDKVVQNNIRQMHERNYTPKYTESFTATVSSNGIKGLLDGAGWIVEKTLENFATAGVGAIGGTAAVLTAPVSGTAAAIIGGTTAIAAGTLAVGEVRDELESNGVYDPEDAEQVIGAGAVIGIIDTLGGKLGSVTSAAKKKAIQELAAEGVTKELGKKMISQGITRTAAKSVAGEAVTEALQEGLIVSFGAVKGVEYTFPEIANRLIDSAVIGGAIGVPGGIAKGRANKISSDTDTPIPQTPDQADANLDQDPEINEDAEENQDSDQDVSSQPDSNTPSLVDGILEGEGISLADQDVSDTQEGGLEAAADARDLEVARGLDDQELAQAIQEMTESGSPQASIDIFQAQLDSRQSVSRETDPDPEAVDETTEDNSAVESDTNTAEGDGDNVVNDPESQSEPVTPENLDEQVRSANEARTEEGDNPDLDILLDELDTAADVARDSGDVESVQDIINQIDTIVNPQQEADNATQENEEEQEGQTQEEVADVPVDQQEDQRQEAQDANNPLADFEREGISIDGATVTEGEQSVDVSANTEAARAILDNGGSVDTLSRDSRFNGASTPSNERGTFSEDSPPSISAAQSRVEQVVAARNRGDASQQDVEDAIRERKSLEVAVTARFREDSPSNLINSVNTLSKIAPNRQTIRIGSPDQRSGFSNLLSNQGATDAEIDFVLSVMDRESITEIDTLDLVSEIAGNSPQIFFSRVQNRFDDITAPEYQNNPDYEYQEYIFQTPDVDNVEGRHFSESIDGVIGHVRGYYNSSEETFYVIEMQSDLFQQVDSSETANLSGEINSPENLFLNVLADDSV